MSDRYRNLAVERTMEILRRLEGRVQGASLKQPAAQTAVARSTVYRILNSLRRTAWFAATARTAATC